MTRSPMLFLVLTTTLAGGCCGSDSSAPRVALLGDRFFADGVNVLARQRQEPLSTEQLVGFVGKPDLKVPWRQVRQSFLSRPGVDNKDAEQAMDSMQGRYAYNKGTPASDASSIDHVDVWFYMWDKPAELVVCDLFHTSAGRMSILVMVEKGHVVGTADIVFGSKPHVGGNLKVLTVFPKE